MNPVESSRTGVAALPLDDVAPARLGMLLRCARKQQSLSRRRVAERIGATPSELRQCERGDAPVAPSMIAALADCYGEALAAQFASRTPIQLETNRLVVGTEEVALQTNDADELLSAYIGIVARLRHTKPGEPIALRTEDVTALSIALGQTSEHIETRIGELLDCTLREARSLHAELVRRRLTIPAAGLLASIAVVAGAGCATHTKSSPAAPPREHVGHAPKAAAETVPSTTQHAVADPTTSVATTTPNQIDVAGITAKLPEPTTTLLIDIGNATSMRSTTTRPERATSTTAKKPAHTPPTPPVTTAATTTTTPTGTTAP